MVGESAYGYLQNVVDVFGIGPKSTHILLENAPRFFLGLRYRGFYIGCKGKESRPLPRTGPLNNPVRYAIFCLCTCLAGLRIRGLALDVRSELSEFVPAPGLQQS